MVAGKSSPIIRALTVLSRRTSGEVRVHLSHAVFEKDVMAMALSLFAEFEMTRTPHRNAVLIYLNLRHRRFAIVADEGIHRALGQRYWDEMAVHLREDLLSTHFENALALSIYGLAESLAKYFPHATHSTS